MCEVYVHWERVHIVHAVWCSCMPAIGAYAVRRCSTSDGGRSTHRNETKICRPFGKIVDKPCDGHKIQRERSPNETRIHTHTTHTNSHTQENASIEFIQSHSIQCRLTVQILFTFVSFVPSNSVGVNVCIGDNYSNSFHKQSAIASSSLHGGDFRDFVVDACWMLMNEFWTNYPSGNLKDFLHFLRSSSCCQTIQPAIFVWNRIETWMNLLESFFCVHPTGQNRLQIVRDIRRSM